MIQFNLLPDVKLQYVKAQRIKHTVISASLMAAGSAFMIFLLLFLTVNVLQKKSMSDLTGDIKKYNSQLKNTPDLGKILTIQNQLGALPDLHSKKAATGRTFRYIQQITPAGISITNFEDDYVLNSMTITGQTDSLDKVNTFVDTIKYTKYTDEKVAAAKAFSGVVMSQFTRTALNATFTITANYEPALFDNASSTVGLTITSGISTPSVVDQPTVIFKKATTNGNN